VVVVVVKLAVVVVKVAAVSVVEVARRVVGKRLTCRKKSPFSFSLNGNLIDSVNVKKTKNFKTVDASTCAVFC
jgi:hypothetical protein